MFNWGFLFYRNNGIRMRFHSIWSFNEKITRKSISRILYFRRSACYLSTSCIATRLELITPRFSGRAAPIFNTEGTSLLKRTDILTIAPQRVYLVSLQPNCTCFLLHLSYPHGWRMLSALLLYGVRTFLPPVEREINKPIFSRMQRYINFVVKRLKDEEGWEDKES